MPVVEIFASRTTLLIILALSVVINIFLLYMVFDNAVSLDYARTEQSALKKRTSQALVILSDIASNASKKQILELSAGLSKQGLIIKEQSSEVKIGDFVFKFSGDKLSTVDYIE